MTEKYKEYSKKNDWCIIRDFQGNELYNPLYDVDEMALNKVDRLGLAWCRFSEWKWDEFILPKPDGFDDLPIFDKYSYERISHPIIMRFLSWIFPEKYQRKATREDFIRPVLRGIESEIGVANALRCHWVYGMKRTEDEWRHWYYTEHFKG